MILATITTRRSVSSMSTEKRGHDGQTYVGRIDNGLVASTRASARGASRTSPITTKSNIEDNAMLLEVHRGVARIASREDGHRSTPGIGDKYHIRGA